MPMFSLWTEGANVAWTIVYQPMADHLVLKLESFSALGTRAASDRTVVRSALRMDVLVRAIDCQQTRS